MRVCPDDNDERDPWKLPAKPADPMALRFARPDVSIAVTPSAITTETQDLFVVSEDGEDYAIPG